MPPHLSTSVRQLIWFSFESGKADNHILNVSGISVRQLRKMPRNCEEFGEVVRPQLTSGRPRKLNRIHQQALLEYLEQRPTAFQDEMSWFLCDHFQVVVVESTIWRGLKRLGWNRKIAIRIARQRCQPLRDEWMTRLGGWRADQLVFLDEIAACARTGMFEIVSIKISANFSLFQEIEDVDGHL